MWLLERLAPDFKTIADFRKNNGKAIRKVCREFVLICRKLNLFTDVFVAIDGSKFKAVNTREKNFTKAKVKRRLEQIDQSIERYLALMASADRLDPDISNPKSERLQGKLDKLQGEIKRLKALEEEILNTGYSYSIRRPSYRTNQPY